jgi:hypothetical protein
MAIYLAAGFLLAQPLKRQSEEEPLSVDETHLLPSDSHHADLSWNTVHNIEHVRSGIGEQMNRRTFEREIRDMDKILASPYVR